MYHKILKLSIARREEFKEMSRKHLILRIFCDTMVVHDSIKVRLEEWVTAHSFHLFEAKRAVDARAGRNL